MIINANVVLVPVSNEVPEHPCVSPVSNQVFERRLIEKYIAENGADPINGHDDVTLNQVAGGGLAPWCNLQNK